MRKDTLLTRQKIIATAERLFAERGIDAVSLHEITRESGQKNKSALSSHFCPCPWEATRRPSTDTDAPVIRCCTAA